MSDMPSGRSNEPGQTAANQARWEKAKGNASLHRDALSPGEETRIKWHDHAHRPNSSQVFCVSALGTLRGLRCRDRVLGDFLSARFPEIATVGRPRRWEIALEAEFPELLNELGSRQPTSIDALCTSSREVVCMEAKLKSDAAHGFGSCSHAGKHCAGFHGPGSDLRTKTSAWCRLENWEGRRAPRAYWSLGKAFFQDRVFEKQARGDVCPFAGGSYQLMRNFLFAAALAEREGKAFFGVLALCPRGNADKLKTQIAEFKSTVLRPAFRDRVQLAYYEDYFETLRRSDEAKAMELAGFLVERLGAALKQQ